MTEGSEANRTTIEGEYTTATVMLARENIEDLTFDQIEEITNHPAFENEIVVQPDCHPGAGCVIGFTMPLADRVVPNVVGVDIGCGMLAVELDSKPDLTEAAIDDRIRETIPMGWHAHDDQTYHVGEDFPWAETTAKVERLQAGRDTDFAFDGYDLEYFKDLCEKAGVDLNKAIDQVGTLGGGNHFIEVAESDRTGNWWLVFHSGSRALGNSVADYWQTEATERRNATAIDPVTAEDLPEEVRDAGGTPADVTDETGRRIDMDRVAAFCRERFEGSEIEANVNRLRQVHHDRQEAFEADRNTDLDYLEGEAAHGYLVDMAFCQTYAWENRRWMAHLVTDALGVEVADSIHSPHNLIDFEDLMIRKGATRAHEGERLIVPYNMGEGSVVLRGKGNPEWNRSAPHGTGRSGSRRWAKKEFTMEEFEAAMDGVFSTSVNKNTIDESPMAYKDPALVESRIDETGEVVDRLRPVINCKADW
ncbi:RtcB family protein [Halococcus sp. IIIV-5B]|uniref:RtcB family protein n=1 Tax=Halococcus sp. IIIV-5B TaxID=2321230 RepID=UPI000E731A36|nr:RtcB family protein [Halococcus sp. IIIV-5B]RJT02522.1 RNA-splicing ligase RtcB [Halococcus sp. IIIV-5B]